jgi:alkanesulfonate monooxygenase SsuD/methylene tetrahydromethanopterin reductase-like flavin-dependent oxidoreductase (luciferase family)
MKFGIFYEHQLPRPWHDGDESKLLRDALEQVELADKLGFDVVWEVEHHFLEEYSHSSAPEVFLAAASQRTRQIRLGHGIVLLPPQYNHPARVAERIATLDLLSGGRVEFGTGESSSEMELSGFGVPREQKRKMWEEMVRLVPQMMVETPFAGCDTPYLKMPPRNVVPKPAQKPHPPLWVACSRRETIHLAAEKGMGALSFAFINPEEARHWVGDYYKTLENAVPAGYAVNANIAITTTFMCCRDEQEAIDKGIDGAHFFGYSLGHYYVYGEHAPGRSNVWQEFEQRREAFGFSRKIVRAGQPEPLGAKILEQGLGALRGAVGTPAQITEFLSGFEQAGIDQVILVSQAGRNRHEDICESLELFAKEVMPRFKDREPAREREKRLRLAPVVEGALRRRERSSREVDESYRVRALPAV